MDDQLKKHYGTGQVGQGGNDGHDAKFVGSRRCFGAWEQAAVRQFSMVGEKQLGPGAALPHEAPDSVAARF